MVPTPRAVPPYPVPSPDQWTEWPPLAGPVCLDGRMLTDGGTGVATYARSLRRAQSTLSDNALVLSAATSNPVVDRMSRWLRAALISGAPVHACSRGDRFVAHDLFRRAQLHFRMRGTLLPVMVPGPPGIMHWTYPVPLRLVGWRNVYTVHDVIPLTHPHLTTIKPRRHGRVLARIVDSAARIVTVSDCARRDILVATKCHPALVVNCGQPVDVAPHACRNDPAPTRDDFLVCGSVDERKNVARLIEAYRASGVSRRLIIVGPPGRPALERMIAATPNVQRLPYLDRQNLIRLIGSARALLMPSLAEGFGLPIAEAMALDTPVLTSRGGATEETAGDAALLVDPLDVRAIASAIQRLATDDELCAALVARGRTQAARFAPERFVDQLAGVYAAVFAERREPA